MRRPPARRSRRLTVAVLTGLAGCADDGPAAGPTVVEVAARPCDRPTRSFGVGVVVDDGLVATAGHTVEGALRDLTVDGTPARVLALDRRTDLALLAVPGVGRMIPAPPMADAAPETAVVVGPGGNVDVRLVRTGALTVHDTTDRRRYRRRVHTVTPGVPDGTSGAPLVDAQGRVLGVVVIDNPRRGVAYAVTAAELARVLAGDMHPRAIPATNCGD